MLDNWFDFKSGQLGSLTRKMMSYNPDDRPSLQEIYNTLALEYQTAHNSSAPSFKSTLDNSQNTNQCNIKPVNKKHTTKKKGLFKRVIGVIDRIVSFLFTSKPRVNNKKPSHLQTDNQLASMPMFMPSLAPNFKRTLPAVPKINTVSRPLVQGVDTVSAPTPAPMQGVNTVSAPTPAPELGIYTVSEPLLGPRR